MQIEKITISGELRGTIWFPPIECTKEFSETFTPEDKPFSHKWLGLRDALLRITNDGDFQSCEIDHAFCKAVYRVDARTIIEKHAQLFPGKLIRDLFVD